MLIFLFFGGCSPNKLLWGIPINLWQNNSYHFTTSCCFFFFHTAKSNRFIFHFNSIHSCNVLCFAISRTGQTAVKSIRRQHGGHAPGTSWAWEATMTHRPLEACSYQRAMVPRGAPFTFSTVGTDSDLAIKASLLVGRVDYYAVNQSGGH